MLHLLLLIALVVQIRFFPMAHNYVVHATPMAATLVEMQPKVPHKEKITTPNPKTIEPSEQKKQLSPKNPKPKPVLPETKQPIAQKKVMVPVKKPSPPAKLEKSKTPTVNKKEHQLSNQLWQQALAEDDALLDAEKTQQAKGIINKYNALILAAIRKHWILPDNYNQDLSCQLLIRLSRDGAVTSVELIKTSGNPGFDRSARTAVYKASPLPVAGDDAIFAMMREINLIAKPQ